MVKRLLILFVYLSFITKPIGGLESTNPILSRLTFADVFGALALFFGFKYIIIGFKELKNVNRVYSLALILFLSMFIPLSLSLNTQATIIESLIILFLILISILFFQIFKHELFKTLFPVIINTAIVASLLGFYDIIAIAIGLPRIFEARAIGEIISGFRNAGQAGAYFLVILSILIPLKYSELKNKLSKKYVKRLNIAIIVSLIFLFLTGKIAAFIGIFVGLTLFLAYRRSFKNLFLMIAIVGIGFFVFENLETIAPNVHNRINYKISSRIIDNVEGTSSNTFFKDNWDGAFKAFGNNPITGTGIGAFYGAYSRYEIHGTYLKMIGEGGIIVSFAYIIFIISFIKLFRFKFNKLNPYDSYLKLMYPFIIGCLVSWSYTYHLRKREFWILVAVVVIIFYTAKIWEYKVKNKLKIK